ncbi:MAG: DUF3857 domain-containing protein [Mucilaginibacter sp.]
MAQNFTYGKASQEEIDMKSYEKDTSAHAVILNEFGKAEITVTNTNDIRLIYEYHVKIKIFDHKAFPNGTIELHLRNNEDNSLVDEINNISGITSYKDDNGSTQVTALDPKSIYKSKDSRYQSTMKFAMPALRDGCIVEYRYILITPFFDHFHTWQFQTELPKIYTEFEAHIPGFWTYNVSLRGALKLSKSQSDIERSCFSARGATCDCVKLDYGMKDVPAFIKEEYMTTPKNFLSALNFNLVEYTNPYTGVKTKVTREWKDVDYQLKDSPEFGGLLKKKELVKEHIPPAILSLTDSTEKAKAIYKWVQGSFKWNNYVGIYSNDGLKKAIEAHSGSIAEINITLINALNAAGLNTEAVLLSTRDHGLINKLYPVIGDFNYVIAKVNINNKSYFLDATDPLLPFGILPINCLNDQGRAFRLDKPSYWVDLDTKQRKTSTFTLDLSLQEDGKMKGKLTHYSQGYEAYLVRKEIKRFNTLDEYVENLNGRLHRLKILKSNITNTDSLNSPITEEYEIEMEAISKSANDRFVLNPYFFHKMTINPFRLPERTYPVDMGMSSDDRFILHIQIPAQYTIESKPQTQSLSLSDRDAKFSTRFDSNDNTYTFSSSIEFNKSIFSSGEYPYLKEFFNKIIRAEKADLVFKKK